MSRPLLYILLLCLAALMAGGRADVSSAHVRFHGPLAHASETVPDDPGRTSLAGGWQQTQWNFTAPFGVNALAAWQNVAAAGRPGGRGTVVAVLDSGVAYEKRGRFRRSPDLARTTFVRGYDFVDRDRHPDDEEGHGTHVASTIAETADNGYGLVGLAWGARIMPVRVLDRHGEGDAGTIAKGVRFAANHRAQIINLSLEFGSGVRAGDIPGLIKAIRFAHERGVVVVAASGNEAYRSIAYPAAATYAISVGATTEHGCRADYSNQGRKLTLVAPGGGADAYLPSDVNCKPDGPDGRDIAQVSYRNARDDFGIHTEEGTSMAVPHVSATAALIIASGVIGAHPAPSAILHRLESTARDLGAEGFDADYGWGLVDAAAATSASAPKTPSRHPASDTGTGGASPTSSG